MYPLIFKQQKVYGWYSPIILLETKWSNEICIKKGRYFIYWIPWRLCSLDRNGASTVGSTEEERAWRWPSLRILHKNWQSVSLSVRTIFYFTPLTLRHLRMTSITDTSNILLKFKFPFTATSKSKKFFFAKNINLAVCVIWIICRTFSEGGIFYDGNCSHQQNW